MRTDVAAPCIGKWDIFDSTDPKDHKRAQNLCVTCPLLGECQSHTAKVRAALSPYGALSGTWSGQLYGIAGRQSIPIALTEERPEIEDQMFTLAEARKAHQRFLEGDRSHRSLIGERVFRRREREKDRARRAA